MPLWDTIHVDLAGSWTVKFQLKDNGKMLTKQVQCFTAVKNATGFPGIIGINNKRSESIARLFGKEWLSRYLRPRRVVYDNGSEFVGYKFQELLDNYAILSVSTTVKNPRANSPVERLHLSIEDMLHNSQLFIGERWIIEQKGAIQAVVWAIHSTINSTTNHTPGKLALGRDMIIQAKVLVDWKKNLSNKEAVANRGLVSENNKRDRPRLPCWEIRYDKVRSNGTKTEAKCTLY